MSQQKDIQITEFQLYFMLSDEQKKGYNYLLERGVYCATCGGKCKNGVNITEIYLNSHNDIMVQGTCKVCNGKVVRIIEFGEDRPFSEKANNFRNALGN